MKKRHKYVVVQACAYDGVEVDGPFESLEAAEAFASASGGRPRRVVHSGFFCASHRFVVVEACLMGGITVHGWFPTREAAEAYCHRHTLMAGTLGSRFSAAAVS